MAVSQSHTRRGSGQSVVEFALVLPLLVFLFVAIVDLGRIYTTMLTVESAAREAADYGSFGAQRWDGEAATANTVTNMKRRACTASMDLPDFAGSAAECTNPLPVLRLSPDLGVTWVDPIVDPGAIAGCELKTRTPPCEVSVTLRYSFRLLVPLNVEVFGVRYGIPSSLEFARTSIFAMTDLELDEAGMGGEP